MNKDTWEHKFADAFFDGFVAHELKVFGQRVMLEENLYEISYDNAVAAYDIHKNQIPEYVADVILKELIKNASQS
jgi:hypothetical protein